MAAEPTPPVFTREMLEQGLRNVQSAASAPAQMFLYGGKRYGKTVLQGYPHPDGSPASTFVWEGPLDELQAAYGKVDQNMIRGLEALSTELDGEPVPLEWGAMNRADRRAHKKNFKQRVKKARAALHPHRLEAELDGRRPL